VFGADYNTEDGTGVRDYIHVVDLAKGHLKALQYIDNKNIIEAINLGTGNGISVLGMISNFEKATGIKIQYQLVERRPGDIATCFADATKALKLLDWKAKYNIEDMCRDSWNWQQNNPDGYQ